uniref:Saccharopine dehydrogenase-like oxidoreductase n=1 Tax=Sinocyclocheilus grahami TaxID=75366 RepID=A0A672PUL1_SINGR
MATLTTSSKRPYHIIVFGASGFTGQFVVEEVTRTCNEGPGGTFQWAVAGRNRDRLEKTLLQAADALCKPELKCVEVIVTDAAETEPLAIMCKQGVIVLNCVGPYRFYGETVMKACIENVAHCIDICGEP